MHKAKILFTEFVTHDTKRFIVEKPEAFTFTSGQAVQVSIDKADWQKKNQTFHVYITKRGFSSRVYYQAIS